MKTINGFVDPQEVAAFNEDFVVGLCIQQHPNYVPATLIQWDGHPQRVFAPSDIKRELTEIDSIEQFTDFQMKALAKHFDFTLP